MKTLTFVLALALALGAVTGLRHASEINALLGTSSTETAASAKIAIVEFATVPTMETLFALQKKIPQATSIVRFDKFESDYFRRAYQVTFSGEFSELQAAFASSGVAVKRIELVQNAKLSSLVPSSSKGVDPLSNYQWALSNDGQKILREIDDIHSETIVGDAKGPKADIGLGQVRSRMAKEAKRDMIVAVVDSGLDTSHEDIVKNILTNTKECDAGQIPFRPQDDKDGNGYKGDCMGWNFTTRDEGDNQVDDELGHGTHVAGIIAAEIGNNIGVSGVAPKIKILPIKVTGERDIPKNGNDINNERGATIITNRVAKAILYAVKMKVDVINFSLGWPISADAEFIRQAFQEARKAGITIVAAAGNNTSAAPVYPCSYEGVICVGAVSISGEVANFSNFGGQVDVMAPGEEILSLFPKGKEPDLFSVRGYEIKNGTSQAAPYVSAQAAILKALIPGITTDEIQARLISTTKAAKWGEKFALNAITDVSAALAAKPAPVVRPVFKNVSQVGFTMADRTFKLQLPIKNYWASASDVKVDVAVDTKNITIDHPSNVVGSLGKGETKTITITGKIASTDARREARLAVKVTAGGKSEIYSQQIVLTRVLKNDRDLKTYPISLLSNRAQLQLSSIRSVRENEPYPDYVFAEPADDRGIQLKLVRWKNGSFGEERPVLLPGAKVVLFAMRVDVNSDGASDYVIATVGQTGEEQWIQFTYLNDKLQPIFGSQANLRVNVEGAVIDDDAMKILAWSRAETPFGKIAVPVFMTAGGLPKVDQNPDPFAFERITKRQRLYYYQPTLEKGAWTLQTRSYDNEKWTTKIREELGLRFREDLGVSTILPQSPADFAQGRIRALVSIGASTLKSYRLISVTGVSQLNDKAYHLEATSFKGQTFEGSNVGSTIDLNKTTPVASSQPALASFYSGTLGRLTTLDGNDPAKIAATQQVSPARKQDNLLGFIQGYTVGSDLIAFYQTKSQLVMRKTGSGTPVQLSEAIDRSSLIPGAVFNAMFFPITMGDEARTKQPAIYVDATYLLANRVYVWTVEDGKFFAPMHLNVEVPKGCKPLAPRRFGQGGQTAYVFLCQEGPTFSIKTLNVE